MEFLKKEIETKPDVPVYIEPLSDIHLGSRNFNRKKFIERRDEIKNDPQRYTILNGDLIDNIMAFKGGTIDKRYAIGVEDPEYPETEDQIYKIVEYLKPIEHKILGAGPGNHEWGNGYVNKKRFVHDICNALKTDYLGAMFMVNIQLVNGKKKLQDYEVWGCHGGYAGMRVGGAINRLQDLAAVWQADAYIHGHIHEKAVYMDNIGYHDLKTNDIGHRSKLYALTGCFMDSYKKGFDGYGDKAPFRRLSKVGTITFSLHPTEHKINAFE